MTGARLLVDGGGTTTRVAVHSPGGPYAELTGPSCNPHSVGPARALATLADLVRQAWRDRPAGVDELESGWLCLSTASSRAAAESVAADLLASGALPAVGELWVTNDVAPLLVHDGRVADRVAVVCGTGTGFCGVHPAAGRIARASGREYLLADEGGGFDLGLQGLRAVVRADDGRGPVTRLTDRLTPWRGVAVAELVEVVHSSPEPKLLISSFAEHVLAAAQEGDGCSRRITAAAAAELVTGIRAVAARTRLPAEHEVVLVGSNLVGRYPVLRDQLCALLHTELPGVTAAPLAGSTLPAVAALAELLPGDQSLQDLLGRCLPLVRTRPVAPRPG